MTRRAWIFAALPLCAAAFQASSADEVADVFRKAALALRDRKPAALWVLFDPKMPGYSRLRSDSGALLGAAEVRSNIEILRNDGGDRHRTIEADWRISILQNERTGSATERTAKVEARLEKNGANWTIVSFAPTGFFAPVHGGDAWDVISAAASALDRPLNLDETIPETDPAMFLQAFDPAMPGYEKLRAGVIGLLRRGPVESSVELISNEGDDRVRTLEVDWTLQVLEDATGLSTLHKQQRVRIRMEHRGKRWRIVEISPLDFFAP
jgi:hypothetical protein